MTKTDALTDKIVILTAAGSSTRMGTGKKKEYLKLDGGTVLSKAAASFLTAAFFSMLIVTVPEGGERMHGKHCLLMKECRHYLKIQNFFLLMAAKPVRNLFSMH